MRKFIVPLLLLVLSFGKVIADSPLTSTGFWTAYEDIPAVKHASESGKVDQQFIHFLALRDVPLDQKLAACNALGWSFEGKGNAQALMDHWNIVPHPNTGLTPKSLKKLPADIRLCMGYLMALDDYFHPEYALPFVEEAAKKFKKSYAAQMILALVQAQVAFDGDWCQVWTLPHNVDVNKSLTRDLRPDACKIIMDYMVLYQGDCK